MKIHIFKITFSITLFHLFFCYSIFGQVKNTTNNSIKDIESLFKKYNNQTPGISIAIIKNNQVVFNSNYGIADLEHKIL